MAFALPIRSRKHLLSTLRVAEARLRVLWFRLALLLAGWLPELVLPQVWGNK